MTTTEIKKEDTGKAVRFTNSNTFNGKKPKKDSASPRQANFERPKPEFDQKIISIRRVTRVVSGGRRFSFAVSIAIGDRKGSVGVGTGKGGDTALAIGKAIRDAKKNMINLKLTKDMSLSFPVKAKYKSSEVMIIPNNGRGLVAGSSVRDILNLAGVRNVTSKIISGSKNKLNNGRVAIKALSVFKTNKKQKRDDSQDQSSSFVGNE